MNIFLLRRGYERYWLVIGLGGIFPDLFLLCFILYYTAVGESADSMFNNLYFQDNWQLVFGYSHGILVYAMTIVLIVSIASLSYWESSSSPEVLPSTTSEKKTAAQNGLVGIGYFAASAFIHSCFDFFLHHDDGHQSFVPFTRWKFHSPVSYWDVDYYAWAWIPIETGAVFYSCYWIYRVREREPRRYGSLRVCFRNLILVGIIISYIVILIGTLYQAISRTDFSNASSEGGR